MKKLLLFAFVLFCSKIVSAQCGAAFVVYPDSINPLGITLSDRSLAIPPLTYMIDYGDGTGTSTSFNHNYSSPGTYMVCYSVSDANGCTSNTCQLITVPFVSAVFITQFADSNFNICTAPQDLQLFFVGETSGMPQTDSVHFQLFFGDGTDSTFTILTFGNTFNEAPVHRYLNPGTYYPMLIAWDENNDTDTAYSNPVIISASCGPVSGMVFIDNNSDCIYNGGDSIADGIYLQILFNGTVVSYTVSDSLGNYSFNQPTGVNYDIVVQPANYYGSHYTISCPASGIITAGSPSSGNNFGLTCAGGFDLTGVVSSWGIRPGQTAYVNVSAYNSRCVSVAGQIDVTIDPMLTPQPNPAYTINGQVVTYLINAGEYSWNFTIPVLVATTANIGDSACVSFSITPVTGDSIPSNNTATYCRAVTNSCDPNEKHVEPIGEGPLGLVRPTEDLTYTILFQNTGTADAINIYILDTLSQYLDPSSIQVIGASHPMEWLILNGNVLRFSFDNIHLADSNSNEPLSHGFVTYSIKQMISNPQSASITNTAGIYFDYNAPVLTNTTLNTVDYFLSTNDADESRNFSVYPSPADKFVTISFPSGSDRTISIMDLDGKIVFEKKCTELFNIISTDELKSGVYFLTTDDAVQNKKLIVIH
jgi:uncharacterized repeat protein (TIGR01451 family)